MDRGIRQRFAAPSARPRLRLAGALVALCLAGIAGCQDAVDPQPPAGQGSVSFRPAATDLETALGGWIDLQVLYDNPAGLTVRWQRPGYEDAVGPRYRFLAHALGPETVSVRVRESGVDHAFAWRITVTESGTPTARFLPPGGSLSLFETQTARFTATPVGPHGPVLWTVDGEGAGSDSLFVLTAPPAGDHEVAVTVALADTVLGHDWLVRVHPLAAATPEAPSDGALRFAEDPHRVTLTWRGIYDSVFPVVNYEVRYSTVGPVSLASWDASADPGTTAHQPENPNHTVTWLLDDLGLVRDTTVWFAVRSRDDRGLLSLPSAPLEVSLPGQWWIEGTVVDPGGDPLAEVTVRDLLSRRVATTDEAGAYLIGPYSGLDTVELVAGTPASSPPGSSWYAALSGTMGPDGSRRHDFRLIPRAGIDDACYLYDRRFLGYFVTITRTRHPSDTRPDRRLYRWDALPVTVHVPDFVSALGVDYGAAAREAVDIWNRNSGRELFRHVADPALAGIGLVFDLDDDTAIGRTILDQPGDGQLVVGDAVPERITIALADYFPEPIRLQETILHEMGHALGLYGHSSCNNSGHLMYVTSNGALDNGPDEAIHEDELRALRLIYDLPQGWDMSPYPLDWP